MVVRLARPTRFVLQPALTCSVQCRLGWPCVDETADRRGLIPLTVQNRPNHRRAATLGIQARLAPCLRSRLACTTTHHTLRGYPASLFLTGATELAVARSLRITLKPCSDDVWFGVHNRLPHQNAAMIARGKFCRIEFAAAALKARQKLIRESGRCWTERGSIRLFSLRRWLFAGACAI